MREGVRVARVIFNLEQFNALIYVGTREGFSGARQSGTQRCGGERAGLAVGGWDVRAALRPRPVCGNARPQRHHSETIIKPFSSAGSGRSKITTME